MTTHSANPEPGAAAPRFFWVWATALIAAGITAAYSNSLSNGFHLDDLYGITPNPWIRSLSHIPRFFVDPSTYNTHAENVDYRPMATTSFAVCHAVSGYDPWSWHILNLLLHGVVCLAVVALGRALVGSARTAPVPGLSEGQGDLASLGAGLLFAVHPVTAGCANYMWARSSLLVAAFLAPATVLYLRTVQRGRVWPVAIVSVLFAGALLSKEEAISFLAVAALAEFLFAPSRRDDPLPKRLVPRAGDLRLVPLVCLAGAYLVVYNRMLPPGHADHWKNASTTSWQYLLTQTGAWWYYVGKVLLPVHQIADYAGYPTAMPLYHAPEGTGGRFAGVLSQLSILGNPGILVSALAWALVGVVSIGAARRLPVVTFLVGAFIVYLSPTSSVVPLAEMVNEHRPYLPDACLILLLAAGVAGAVRAVASRPGPAYAALVLGLCVPLTIATRARNHVFYDELSYWEDCARKDPASARAQLNHGMELWKLGKNAETERCFREAVRLWPEWFFGHINLALFLNQQGARDEARWHFDRAVELGERGGRSAIPVYYRGINRLERGDAAGAEADLRLAVERASVKVRERVGLAKALLALEREDEAIEQINAGRALDPAAFAELAVPVNDAGVKRMARRELDLAERCFVVAGALAPGLDLPEINLGVLADFRGRPADAAAHFDRAVALNPRAPGPFRFRAASREKGGDMRGAMADYRAAAERDPRATSDLVRLAELLLNAGERAEAQSVIARGEAVDPVAFAGLRRRLTSP